MLMHDELMGKTVTDKITGFKGVVTSYTYHMTGCNQCIVAPPVDPKTGEIKDSAWFDVQRLTVDAKKEQILLDNSKTPGACAVPASRRDGFRG